MIRLASIESVLEPAEIVEQLEAGGAALFEMELRSDNIVARDRGGEMHAVIARRDGRRRVSRYRVVGVDEIEMRVVGHVGEDRVRARLAHAVPANLRNLERAAV